jgi:Tol biopolymer transport system component
MRRVSQGTLARRMRRVGAIAPRSIGYSVTAMTAAAITAGGVVSLGLSAAAAGDAISPASVAVNDRVPTWASQGFVAFKCDNGICLMRPNGSQERPLLEGPEPAPQWDPALSPDGRFIAFRGYHGPGDGAFGLYSAQTDGCGVRRLTTSIAANPSWSHDGKWIAFDTSGEGEIWKVRTTGGGRFRVTRGVLRGHASSPAWSPTANTIALVRTVNGRGELWAIDANGSNARRLHGGNRGSDAMPSWSHDGTKLVFVTQRGGISSLGVVRADGTHSRTLFARRGSILTPVWLPGDKGLAFVAGAAGSGAVFVARPDGSDVRRVSTQLTQEISWVGAALPRRRC